MKRTKETKEAKGSKTAANSSRSHSGQGDGGRMAAASEGEISAARRLALSVLMAAEGAGSGAPKLKSKRPNSSASPSAHSPISPPPPPPLDDLLHRALEAARLSPPDAALAFQIVQGVTRHRLFLDSVILPLVRRGGGGRAAIAPAVMTILRMGAFQHLFLDRIPPHAVVNESVLLARETLQRQLAGGGKAKEQRIHAASGFVNALMRRIATMDRAAFSAIAPSSATASSPAALDLAPDASREAVLARFSLPEWIAREIEAAYGAESLRAEAEAFLQPAPLVLRLNALRGNSHENQEAIAAELQRLGIAPGALQPARFVPEAIRLSHSLDPARLESVREGRAAIQDEAAQIAAHWLNPQPGWRIGDFCAAPGGKTAHLAALMNNEGEIWALDANPSRLPLIEETCGRLGCSACVRIARNSPEIRAKWRGAEPGDGASRGLDAALVDAPCTALGTLRRHPDAKWRHTEADPPRMAARQRRILEEAARCVRPGGILVYCVCTFTRAETLDVIEDFLAAHRGDWTRDTAWTPPAWASPDWRTPKGDWLTRTSRDGMDAFFLSRLRLRPARNREM